MRVIGGTFRGRKLKTFKGSAIRPTTDKVREAVFNILGPLLPLERALDLFAGTGAMGIEALSRGSLEAFFVDSSPKAVTIIKDNLEALGLSENTRVYRKDVKSAVNSFSENGELFDLIFIDPPYEAGLLLQTLGLIAGKDRGDAILKPGGVIVAESSKRELVDSENVPPGLNLIDSRSYGDNKINIFKLTTNEEEKELNG
jgi:16S rRNA (guanine(966)-N(2))-methyltransferase RsmD